MLPEFIIVEVDTDQFIVAQHKDGVIYRKFLTAVGQPSAEVAHAALMQQKEPAFDPSSRAVRGTLNPEARVRIEKNDEGIIKGAIGNDDEIGRHKEDDQFDRKGGPHDTDRG